MYIVQSISDNIEQLQQKYLLLELDTIKIKDDLLSTAYCVIDNDHISLDEIATIGSKENLHKALIRNYKQQNWDFCLEALQHLRGSFKGEVDSFYDELLIRISLLKDKDKAEDWSPIIDKSI